MKYLAPLTLASLLTAGGSVLAQTPSNDHSAHHPAPSTAATPAASKDMTEGEVRTVNKSAGKITLKHGEIKNLDMGAMTMVFQVKDPALLDKVKAGDKVRFTADQIKGAYVVLTIELIQP